MIKVWGRTNSINVQKVMWTIAELGLRHERIDAGGKFGGLDGDLYGQMNPNRRIPVIDDEGTVVWESQACVRYLAAKYGQGGLWPENPGERSVADRWMDWYLTTMHPQMHTLFWGLIRTAPAERDQSAIDQAAKAIQPLWGMVDQQLSKTGWIAGQNLTMGDIPLGCAWWRFSHLGQAELALPHLKAWFDVLCERPAFREHVMIDVT